MLQSLRLGRNHGGLGALAGMGYSARPFPAGLNFNGLRIGRGSQLIVEPFEKYEGTSPCFENLLALIPQFVGGVPKGEGKGCYNGGCDSSEEPIMFVDEAQRNIEIEL